MHAKLLSGGQDDATHNRLGTAGLEGTGGTGRPGCSAGGRRQGLVGQRVDAPSEARSADGGRPAPHEHTKQPGTTTRSSTARNTSGATHHRGIAKPPGPAGTGRLNQHQRIIEESRQCRDYRDRFPGARSRCRASMRCPWRYLPCGDPHRRRWRPEWSSRRRSRRWSPRIRLGSGSGPAGWRTPECRCR